MKKSIVLIAFVAIVKMGVIASPNSDKVPSQVKDSFNVKFPGVKAKWEKENLNFEANFEKGNKDMSAVFDSTGILLETEIELEVTDLPKSISDYIQKNNKGKIKEAAKIVDAKGTITYEVEIGKSDLLFDSNGNFISETKS